MVLEKESWLRLPSETVQVISFAGLVGDGAPLIVPSVHSSTSSSDIHSMKSENPLGISSRKSGFSLWARSDNLFMQKLTHASRESDIFSPVKGAILGNADGRISEDGFHDNKASPKDIDINGGSSVSEDENEDLLADFIDEDSQLPSRISKPRLERNSFSQLNDDEFSAQTGSSICLLRLSFFSYLDLKED